MAKTPTKLAMKAGSTVEVTQAMVSLKAEDLINPDDLKVTRPEPSIRIVELQPQADGSFKDADVAYKTAQSAGVDLCVKADSKIILLPGRVFTLHTGVRLLVNDYIPAPGKLIVGKLYPRSSLRGKGVTFLGTGIIDIDYEGEIIIKAMLLTTGTSLRINPGEAVAQLVFEEVLRPTGIKIVEAVRGEGAFGSTSR